MQEIRDYFKKYYPKRNGKIIWTGFEKALARVKAEDYPTLCQSVIHYANSEMVKRGIGIKDPCRFIWDSRNGEFYWQDWIVPEVSKEDMVKQEADRKRMKEELKRAYQDRERLSGYLEALDFSDLRRIPLDERIGRLTEKIEKIEERLG